MHLVNPSGLAWENRRVKNDYRDCCDLLDRMRLGKLPEAWIAPHAVRELRELVRFRARLVMLRTGLKAQLKAVLAKHGLRPPVNDLWGVAGPVWLDQLDLPRAYTTRIESIRDLVEVYDREIDMLEREIHRELKDDAGYRAIQAIPGVGPTIAAIMVAEIGDVSRFKSPAGPVLVGGVDPQAPRVRHQGPPRAYHQGRLETGALGGHRGGLQRSGRPQTQSGLPPHRRAATQDRRPGGGGPQARHHGLLRATRRTHPLPRRSRAGRMTRIGHSQGARSCNGMTPTSVATSTK